MKTLWCKNQENPSDRISHAWAPLTRNIEVFKNKLISVNIAHRSKCIERFVDAQFFQAGFHHAYCVGTMSLQLRSSFFN